MVAFRQKVEQIQWGTFIPQACDPVFERVVTTAVLVGDLDAPEYERAFADYVSAEHYPPAMPWIDPAKDMAAIREALALRLMSRRQAVAERGYSVEALDAEIAADHAREAALGITQTINPTAAPNPKPQGGDDADGT